MMPEIQVVVFTTLLSGILSYAWWLRFRVWMLRQDLFTIRDDLWDVMRQAGRLDDPTYLEMREALNALIRTAPLLSVLTVLRLVSQGTHANILIEAELEPALQEARNRTILRLTRYIFMETLSGIVVQLALLVLVLIIALPLRYTMEFLNKLVTRLFASNELLEFGRLAVDSPTLLNL